MDAVSVWVEHLRQQAIEAQAKAADAWAVLADCRHSLGVLHGDSFAARYIRARVPERARDAYRAGIIAREARRQYQAALIVLAQDAGTEDPERHGWRVGVMSDVLGCIEDDEP